MTIHSFFVLFAVSTLIENPATAQQIVGLITGMGV